MPRIDPPRWRILVSAPKSAEKSREAPPFTRRGGIQQQTLSHSTVIVSLMNADYTLTFKRTFRPDYPTQSPTHQLNSANHLSCIAWSNALLRDQVSSSFRFSSLPFNPSLPRLTLFFSPQLENIAIIACASCGA